MSLTDFLDVPVIDGHIHFPRPALMDDLLAVMEATQTGRANLVAVPDLQVVNQNPALIHFKAHHPGRAYLCGALDYTQVWADPAHAAQHLAAQVITLRTIGFDGLKMIEGKPMVRKLLDIPLYAPQYRGLWATLEASGWPIVLHLADPETFWDPDRCPSWAHAQGWFYGDGTHLPQETFYAEVDDVLRRHPHLRLVLAHFYFLSADLARAGSFLDAHPHVSFDLTPGVEMYLNFAGNLDAARDFFIQYQERLIYGTDIGASAIQLEPGQGLDKEESLGRAWVVRRFLETGETFTAPQGVGHWAGMDGGPFHGIALPADVLHKIYHANFERLFGAAPAPLDLGAAREEMARQARLVDELAGGQAANNPAREVARTLAAMAGE